MKEIDIIELDFLTRVSKAMEARGMTATALARKANVSHSGVFRVLSGAVGLSFERAYQLADALGLEFYPMLRMKEPAHGPADRDGGRKTEIGERDPDRAGAFAATANVR